MSTAIRPNFSISALSTNPEVPNHSDAESDGAVTVSVGEPMRLDTGIRSYHRHQRAVLRPRTLNDRRYTLEAFCEHTNNPQLRSVKAKHISDWLASMDVSAATVRQRLSAVRCFFRWALEQRLVKIDPTATLRSPRQPRSAPRSFTLEQIRRLDAALPDARAVLIIALMLDMGLRAGEVARLELADLDLFSGVARIVGKGGHERLLPITPMVRSRLDVYLNERGRGAGPLIRSKNDPRLGIRVNRITNMVGEWMTDAGVKESRYDGRSAHALRHSTAENLYRHGVDLRTIAAALGHASPTTTWIYLRHTHSVEDLRAVMGQEYVDEARPTLRAVPGPAPIADTPA